MSDAIIGTESMISLGQQNIEAVLRSGQIWTTGLQSLGGQVAAGAGTQFEHTMGVVRQMATVGSIKDALDLQAGLVRSTIEAMVSASGKLSDAAMKLAEEAMQPITERFAAATRTMRPATN